MDYFSSLGDIEAFIQTQKDDKKWIRSGQVVDTGAKVYGYRVDNVHNETYRMWNGMQRNAGRHSGDIEVIQEEDDEEASFIDADGNPVAHANEKKKKKALLKFKSGDGQRTLEQSKNITLDSFDTQHEVDPLFRKTT